MYLNTTKSYHAINGTAINNNKNYGTRKKKARYRIKMNKIISNNKKFCSNIICCKIPTQLLL